MKEYKVILASSTLDLEQKVNDHLKMNWQLQGGASITYNRRRGSNEIFYVQAMVKQEKRH